MSDHSAGGGCQWFAERCGWTLRRGNVMVEGNLDAKYFGFANRLYRDQHGLDLIGKDLSLFAAGTGDEGGTYGVIEKFPTLHALSRLDLDAHGKVKYRIIALLDDDPKGRAAIKHMGQNRTLKENAQLFLLRRKMPRKTRDAVPLTAHVKTANEIFNGLPCVIEDLVDSTLCDLYAEQFPQHVIGPIRAIGGGHHRGWTEDGKHGLCRFVQTNAQLGDVSQFLDTLKSLRFYLGLSPDGVT